MLVGGDSKGLGGIVVYSDRPLTRKLVKEGKAIYDGVVYVQRHLPKWVYKTEEYTMIAVDTRTDGNKFLMIFRNDRECKDTELKLCWIKEWSE